MRYADFRIVEEPIPQGTTAPEQSSLDSGPPYPPEERDAVKQMQSRLEELGYSVGSTGIDGKYGPRTTRAVRAFKKDNNISTPSGSMSEDDLAALASAKKLDKPTPTGNEGGGSGAFDYANAVPVDDLKPSSSHLNGRESRKATVRYNNPGGMYPAGWQKRFGGERGGTIGGGHLIAYFPDKVNGGAALFALLNGSAYVNKTVADALKRWTGNNNANSYIAWMARHGINTGETVGNYLANKDAAIALATLMARWETGHAYPMSLDDWESAYRLARIG